MWPFKSKSVTVTDMEKRAVGSGFTAEVLAARESWISGSRGLGELTACVQTCVTLWENGLSMADVSGTGLLTRRNLALTARALALRGECVFLIEDDVLVPCSDWSLTTRNGAPRAYRLTVSEAGGGVTRTALSQEVLHFRLASDVAAPWIGVAPLTRASLTAGLLHELEHALKEVYSNAPIGTQIVSVPENPQADNDDLGRGFRGQRGRVLVRESVNVMAAGGALPQSDWKPSSVTPDLSKSMSVESLDRARDAIGMVYGLLPGMTASAATGPLIREGQRHLATWMLQPVAMMMAEETGAKTGGSVTIDTLRPLQAYDAGSRARAVSGVITALAAAKAGGVDAADVEKAMRLVDWGD